MEVRARVWVRMGRRCCRGGEEVAADRMLVEVFLPDGREWEGSLVVTSMRAIVKKRRTICMAMKAVSTVEELEVVVTKWSD